MTLKRILPTAGRGMTTDWKTSYTVAAKSSDPSAMSSQSTGDMGAAYTSHPA